MTESDGALPHVAMPAERTASRSWRVSAAEVRAAVVVVVALAIVGLLVGLVWAHVAPRALYTVVDVKQRLAQQNDVESEAQVGVDGWFALIGAGVGLLTGAVAWRWRSARGPFLMVVLAVASLLSAVIAWRFGLWVGRHPTQTQLQTIFDKVGNTFRPPIKMRAKAALFFQPVGAVIAALVSFAFSTEERQHRREAQARATEIDGYAQALSEAQTDGFEPLGAHTAAAWIGEAWPGEYKRSAPVHQPEANAFGWFVKSPWSSLTADQAARLVTTYVPAENNADSVGILHEVFGWSDAQAHAAFAEHVAGRSADE